MICAPIQRGSRIFGPRVLSLTLLGLAIVLPMYSRAQSDSVPLTDVRAHTYFDRARSLSGLRVKGAPPFHMKGSFEAMGSAELIGRGTYEETWISPTEWRREVTLKGEAVVESRNGDTIYRKFKGAYAPRRCDELLDVMSIWLPFETRGDSDDSDWHVVEAPLSGVPLIRISRGHIDDRDKPDTETIMYYFDPTTGLLRAYFDMAEIAVFNGFQQFNSVQVPRRISVAEYGQQILQLNVDVLESASTLAVNSFTVDGAQKWPADFEEGTAVSMTPPKAVKQVKPQYPDNARLRNVHQKVLCTATIDRHGHVRGVTFQGDADPALQSAVREAIFQWEFTPATVKGRPAPLSMRFAFEF